MNNSNRFFGYQDQKHTEGIQLARKLFEHRLHFNIFLGVPLDMLLMQGNKIYPIICMT